MLNQALVSPAMSGVILARSPVAQFQLSRGSSTMTLSATMFDRNYVLLSVSEDKRALYSHPYALQANAKASVERFLVAECASFLKEYLHTAESRLDIVMFRAAAGELKNHSEYSVSSAG